METVLFYVVIFLSHIIQGFTGFAGTLLAMPFSMRLVGTSTAAPVLNGLGFAAGIYVFIEKHKYVVWKELAIVLAVMIPTMLGGAALRRLLSGSERLLFVLLGIIVLVLSAKGIYDLLAEKKGWKTLRLPSAVRWVSLVLAGIVHGMFVCGGPFLIIYLTERLPDKEPFRATLSTSWIFLNGILLIAQIVTGAWTLRLLQLQLIALPVLVLAMLIGSLLCRRMNQRVFMVVTYLLLLLSGISLFFK